MQKNKPVISILVPCYNVEKFLPQCLDSIVNQTLRDIEIICINDGSTDKTLDIITSYAKHDDRIVVIDKPNEGYGKSMNRGLDAATGKYIGIVESDDWVDANMFESLVRIAEENDVQVVKSNFYEYTTTNGEENKLRRLIPEHNADRVICARQETGIFLCQPSIWSAIYRRDFLNENNIRFLESPGASYQDVGFNFKVWLMSDRVWLTPVAYLHYRCDNENASVKSKSKVLCVCDEWNEVERYISEHSEMFDGTRELIPHVKWGNYKWNLLRLDEPARTEFQQVLTREYDGHIKRDEFRRIFFDDRSWFDILHMIYPQSLSVRFWRIFYRLISPIYKTRVKYCTKKYYLFGFIHVRNTKKLPQIKVTVK